MELAPDVRLRLGERLIESVPVFADPEVDQAWSEEIARRIRDIDEGRVQVRARRSVSE